MDPNELTGRTGTHIVSISDLLVELHRDVAEPFLKMKEAAAQDGIALTAISGFRDFDKQATIWNAKWRGERPLHDVAGKPVDFSSLSPIERAHTILIWSALPGASRHHWGTDIDVIDANTRPPGYKVELLPYEYEEGGYFHKLHQWLETHMESFGFFFPYKTYNGGISTEPWHISYAPVSMPALKRFQLEQLQEAVETKAIEGKETIVEILPEIFERYVRNINLPESAELRS